MAYTTPTTVGNQGGPVIKPFYSDWMRANLYPTVHMRQLGKRVEVPDGYGLEVTIPRWGSPITNTNGVTGLASGTDTDATIAERTLVSDTSTVTPKTMDAASLKGEFTGFEGARGYTDMTQVLTYADWIQGANESLLAEMAVVLDDYILAEIDGNTPVTYGALDGNDIASTDVFDSSYAASFLPRMAGKNVPLWDDGSLRVVTNPLVLYDIFQGTGPADWVTVKRYNDASDIYRGEVGMWYGNRFLVSTNIPTIVGTAGADGITSGLSVFPMYVCAPESFYTIERGGQDGVQVIHHPPGSGGATGDPTNKFGTLSVKVLFGAKAAPAAEHRIFKQLVAFSLDYTTAAI